MSIKKKNSFAIFILFLFTFFFSNLCKSLMLENSPFSSFIQKQYYQLSSITEEFGSSQLIWIVLYLLKKLNFKLKISKYMYMYIYIPVPDRFTNTKHLRRKGKKAHQCRFCQKIAGDNLSNSFVGQVLF